MVHGSRERVVEAFWILNDFVGDLIGATRAFVYFDSSKFKAGATDQVLRIYNKMADAFLYVTLAKWIEFYDHYRDVIPSEIRDVCKKLKSDLEKRGVRDFRNQVVGHIWSDEHRRPLSSKEIDELERKMTNGDPEGFLRWVNDPENRLGATVVGTSEAVRDAIQTKWSLSEQELKTGRR